MIAWTGHIEPTTVERITDNPVVMVCAMVVVMLIGVYAEVWCARVLSAAVVDTTVEMYATADERDRAEAAKR